MNISVCIGSPCHLKGSYDIINVFKRMIAQNQLAEQVNLSASFCLGKCQQGVAVRIDDEIVTGVNPENAEEIFREKVMKELQ